MAKNENVEKGTKKRVALSRQEKKQQKIILITLIVVSVLIIGSITFGLLNEYVFKYNRPIATVNGENLLPAEFEKQVRFNRSQLLQQYMQYQQLSAMFGSDPMMGGQFTDTLRQIESQLLPDGAIVIGSSVLNQVTDQMLINQEAQKMGILISEEDVNKAFQAAFGYYPAGTPTPKPSPTSYVASTLSPQQLAIITLTPTEAPAAMEATATPESAEVESLEPTPTAEPLPTATAYTESMFGEQISTYLNMLERLEIGFTEADLKKVIRDQLTYEKVNEVVTADVSAVEEQVWARHILVKEKIAAQVIVDKLKQGEDWAELASELSLDTANKDKGGDLGWFSRGMMVPAFEETAFGLQVGEISDPVETQFGWHIIQVLGHEDRPLSTSAYQTRLNDAFQTWLNQVRQAATVVIADNWQDFVPLTPALNQETIQLLQENP
jgi:parvulin-like peptidyl-prolyl isomerase